MDNKFHSAFMPTETMKLESMTLKEQVARYNEIEAAEYTNRVLPGNDEDAEMIGRGTIDGIKVIAYYYIPISVDFEMIDWEAAITEFKINEDL